MSRPSLIDLTVPKVPKRSLCTLHDMAAERCLICQETRKRFEAQPVETCAWSVELDDVEGFSWRGACGARWEFTVHGPVENKMHFCPNCGKPLAVLEAE